MQSSPRDPPHHDGPPWQPARWGRWLALAGVLAAAALVGVSEWSVGGWATAPLADVRRPADLALTGGGDRPSGLTVHITGEIAGVAEVWADNWQPQRLSGRVDWREYHDWFEPDCTLHYRPIVGPVSGRLVVRYQFH